MANQLCSSLKNRGKYARYIVPHVAGDIRLQTCSRPCITMERFTKFTLFTSPRTMNSNKTDQVLEKIRKKSEQLRRTGSMLDDQEILQKSRLVGGLAVSNSFGIRRSSPRFRCNDMAKKPSSPGLQTNPGRRPAFISRFRLDRLANGMD